MKIIESNKNDNGVIDLKCLKAISSNPFNQTNTIRENGIPNTSRSNSSFSSLFSNKNGSKDSNVSTTDSNSNSNTIVRKNKLGSASSNSHSLLNLYNGNNSETSIHYSSSSSLINSRDSLTVSSRPLSSRTYFNINKNLGNKGRNIMNSSNQKLITANDSKEN